MKALREDLREHVLKPLDENHELWVATANHDDLAAGRAVP